MLQLGFLKRVEDETYGKAEIIVAKGDPENANELSGYLFNEFMLIIRQCCMLDYHHHYHYY